MTINIHLLAFLPCGQATTGVLLQVLQASHRERTCSCDKSWSHLLLIISRSKNN